MERQPKERKSHMQPDGTCLKNERTEVLCVLSEWWDRPGTPEKHKKGNLGLTLGDVEPLEFCAREWWNVHRLQIEKAGSPPEEML